MTGDLRRSLGLTAALAIAVTNMIGQGVFLKARTMLCNTGSASGMLAAWIVAGLLALCGALALSELGAALPESGGIIAFVRRAYGHVAAFACGWETMFVGGPAAIAALAAGAAIFLDVLLRHALSNAGVSLGIAPVVLHVSGLQAFALGLIALVTLVNVLPTAVNGWIATLLTAVKVALVAGIALGGLLYAAAHPAAGASVAAGPSCAGVAAAVRGGAAGFSAALIGALYAYQGWQSLALVAGEVRDPGRTLPRALIAGVVLVIVLYVGVNAAYLAVLGPGALAALPPGTSVGVSVAHVVFGPQAADVAAVLIFGSIVATLHATVFTVARVTYAVPADVREFAVLGRLSPQGVPFVAVFVTSVVAVPLVLTGSFDSLSNYLTFNSWVIYVATGIALFVLRRREPHLARPYRSFGYPIVPLIFVAVGAWLVVQTLASDPRNSLVGVVILLASLPVYALLARRRTRPAISLPEMP